MASTNKTTNYELSQFLGTDKPAWLSDYNTDMSKIDTQMKLNADGVTSAAGSASTANTSIGTLANLTTDVKTSLVGAINEVDAHADTAQNTATSASTAANTANTNLAKFNLTERTTLSPSTTKGSIDSTLTSVQFATDTTSSIFKIYGRVYVNGLANITGSIAITLGTTTLTPSAAYSINTGALVCRTYSNGRSDTVPRNLTVNTDGTIVISDTLPAGGLVTDYSIMLPPCLYFNTDFGDA